MMTTKKKESTTSCDERSQTDKFKKLARELEADEDEKHWDERLKKVAKPKAAETKNGPIDQ